MVWFQCEDCGENLKKPKLANHFFMCSAHKLSCIDCGRTFDQQSVQSHTQCITESEKYGPKGQGNASHNGQTKPDKPKKNSDVDINVGLSSHAPWFCSLCNTQATSKQTLLLHADGKKHGAKARAFRVAEKQSNQTEEPTPSEKDAVGNVQKVESAEANGYNNKVQEIHLQKDSDLAVTGGEKESQTKKRKVEASENGLSKKSGEKNACDLTNGEVIQAEKFEASQRNSKKKGADESFKCKDQADKQVSVVEASHSKPKWKKIITSTLKLSDGIMKIKKLQKFVLEALKESGITEDEEQLRDKLMHKIYLKGILVFCSSDSLMLTRCCMLQISSSTRFTIENKHIRLVAETEQS